MYGIFISIIAFIVWVFGEHVLLSGAIYRGLIIIWASITLWALMFFKPWMRYRGTDIIKNNLSALLSVCAVVSAAAGVVVVRNFPKYGLYLFVISGILLFAAKPKNEKFFAFYELPGTANNKEKWEIGFFIFLVVVTFVIRFTGLESVIRGGNGGEGLVFSGTGLLASNGTPYMPHIGGGTDWPTLTFYNGIIFAKIFGWVIGSFRASTAFYGFLSVIAFFFLARRLTSPFTAAIMSVMYTAMMSHITISRNYVALAILFLPAILGIYFILIGREKNKWQYYLLAGLAGGLSLQGYIPGRGVIMLFAGWFIWMFMTKKNIFHNAKNLIIFLAGFVIVSSPVLYFSIVHPDQYWNYVASVNPSRTGGPMAYLHMLLGNIPSYSGMFHIRSAWDINLHMPYQPVLDPVIGILFPLGLFMTACAFWEPVPSLLLIFFLGSMVPGLLGGGGSPQPDTRRILMTFPFIFLIGGYAVEKVKRVFYSYGNKILYGFFVAVGIAAAAWSLQNGITEYFVRFVNSPAVKVNGGMHLYELGQDLKKYKTARVYSMPYYLMNDYVQIFISSDRRLEAMKFPDNMFILDTPSDYLFYLGPFYENLTPLFKRCFPNSDVKVIREDKKMENAEYYTTLPLVQGAFRHADQYVPYVFSARVYVPASDVKDFHTMLFMKDKEESKRVKVFDNSVFAESNAGKNVTLNGAMMIPEVSQTENSRLPVTFSINWPGWKLMIDGKQVAMGVSFQADSGIHFFEIKGIVPAGAKGDLPLKVLRVGDGDMVKSGHIIAVDGRFGARIFHTPGEKTWDKPYTYSHRLLTPNVRMYDGMSMQLPFSLKEVSYMRVPESGEYTINGNNKNRMKIVVNGIVTFENLNDTQTFKQTAINLTKDKPVKVEVYQIVEGVPSQNRALTIFVKGPGMKTEVIAPYDWFTPVD